MKSLFVARAFMAVLVAGFATGQTRVDLRTQSKSIDFSAATTTKPFKSGTVLPAVCGVGEGFFKSDASPGSNWYACTAENTWTAQAGGATQMSQFGDLKLTVASPLQLTVAGGTYRIGTTTFTVPSTSYLIQQPVITSITANGTATTVTLQPAGTFHNGDSLNIQGAAGCTAMNGLWLITQISATQFSLPFDSRSCTYTANSASAGVNSNATGTVFLYGNSTGTMTLEHPSSAGLIISCAGPCVTRQTTSPSFQSGGVPLASITLLQGRWNAATDARAFLSNLAFVDGIGITSTDFGGIRAVSVDASVARTTIPNIWTGDNDFSSAPSVTIRRGVGMPTSEACSSAAHVGRLYERADTQGPNASLYVCSQTGAGVFGWELAQLGGGLVSPASGGLQIRSAKQPSCEASRRGTFFYVAGAPGVKDSVQVCAKDAGEVFAWRVIY